MAMDVAECDRIIAACAASGVKLGVAYYRHFYPIVHRIREATTEMESQVNRLYRGRQAYDLEDGAKLDLDRAIEQLTYMARTLRDVQREQSKVVYLQAA